jgi:hypothetical protein
MSAAAEWTYPKWHGPGGESALSVFNSLTGDKVPFVGADAKNSKGI